MNLNTLARNGAFEVAGVTAEVVAPAGRSGGDREGTGPALSVDGGAGARPETVCR